MTDLRPADSPSVQLHKRQFVWQILVPILLVVVLGLAAGGLVIAATFSGKGNARLWADVSIIWLIAPALMLAFVGVLVMAALVYGMGKLLQVTPRYTGKAQGIFAMIAAWARKIADGAVKPIVWVRQARAAAGSLFKSKAGK